MNTKPNIEPELIEGIRKTIFRFRKRPLNYFTESDIHSSLVNDILDGNSEKFLIRNNDDKNNPEISLVHNEYPTNFRYKKADLLDYAEQLENENIKDLLKKTTIEKYNDNENQEKEKYGDRGNFDLSVLNLNFIKAMYEQSSKLDYVYKETKHNPVHKNTEIINHIINKDVNYILERKDKLINISELDYAIEVKFIHHFNARNKQMLYEVIQDNSKLKLAKCHSDNYLKTINLIFCSSQEKERNNNTESVINKVKRYIEERKIEDYDNKKFIIPDGLINIFIQSYFSGDSKNTPKPIISLNKNANESDKTLAVNLAKAIKSNLV